MSITSLSHPSSVLSCIIGNMYSGHVHEYKPIRTYVNSVPVTGQLNMKHVNTGQHIHTEKSKYE